LALSPHQSSQCEAQQYVAATSEWLVAPDIDYRVSSVAKIAGRFA
jgi:hypothetical protein